MARAQRASTRDETRAEAQRLFTERGVREKSTLLHDDNPVVTPRRCRSNWSKIPPDAGLPELTDRARRSESARRRPH